jgi:antitoxin HicB
MKMEKKGGKSTKEIRSLDYYLSKQYPFIVYPAEEGGYVAEIEELIGCVTQGETLEEVSQRIENAKCAWIETAFEDGLEIPIPRTEEEYSGKFVLRLPKYLHRRLAEQAMHEGVSLNQFVATLISGNVTTHEDTGAQTKILINEIRKLFDENLKTERVIQFAYRVSAWDFAREEIPLGLSPILESTEREVVAV